MTLATFRVEEKQPHHVASEAEVLHRQGDYSCSDIKKSKET